MGKANVPQALYLHETDNPVFGQTVHPLNQDRGPGGSSGGDAALVAAGVVPLAFGNDLAGSIRQPAHACGLVGYLPSTRCLTRFTVDTKGRPVDVQLVSCPTAFREATLEAAWGWRFWPARVNGRAVDSTFVVGFTFTPR